MQSNHPTCQTFFDLDFEPDIMVGPATLNFLTDFFCRNSASVEGVLLILQLAYLKHFDEPLTTFVRDEQLDTSFTELASKKLSDSKAAAFVSSLFSWSFGPQELSSNEEGWPVNNVAGLLTSIAEARTDFRSRLRRLKLALGMIRKIDEVMLHLGYRGTGTEMTPLEMMSASLKGGLGREGKYLGTMTRSVALYIPNPSQCFSPFVGGTQEIVRREALDLTAGTAVFSRRAPRSPR
jgi:origin recognition complex subunit 3